MKNRHRIALAALLVLLPSLLWAQTQPVSNVIAQVPSPLSLEVLPTFDLPVGDTAQYFTFGGAMDLGVKYRLPGSIFTLLGGLEYCYAPVQAATSLSMVAPRVGVGVQIPLASFISVFATAVGGYYFATYNDFTMSVTDPYLAGSLGMRFTIAPTFSLEVAGQYKYYAGLYQGASVSAGMDIALGNLGGSV
ncbi:MAG TPA: hypothetical protein VHE79_08465, partial [Spirochaetia bacterium]